MRRIPPQAGVMLYTGAGLVGPGLVIYQLPSYLAATLGERLEAVAGLVICGLFGGTFCGG